MNNTFCTYIDESGDEGFSFGKGSSDWFILSAVITKKATDLQTVKLVDGVRLKLGKPPKKPLHFRDLRHEHRLPYIDAIANAKLSTVSILIHKPSLKEPEKFRQRYRLYFYAVRLLLERISWYCRDHKTGHDGGDGSTEIIFSNRSGMSYQEMRDYISYLKDHTGVFDVRIEWGSINADLITAFSPGKRMGLQIADAVAGSFFYAVEPTAYGYTEDRYARMLKPVVYHHKGRYSGYGIKLWPREVDSLFLQNKNSVWFRKEYK